MESSAPRAIAVIFAGGTGSRMNGATMPKQFLELGGRPIIVHTLRHFQGHPEIGAIFIACLEPWIGALEGFVDRFGLDKVKRIVPGGATCQLSIAEGLEAAAKWIEDEAPAADPVVLVHDGVRPLIDASTITRCIRSVEENGPTATVAPASETVIVTSNGQVDEVLDRSRCQLARAPQGFRFSELLAEHRRAREEGLTDFIDCVSLMSHYGHVISTVEGPPDNIKITTRRDFFAFKGYVDYKEMAQLWEN